MKFIHTMLSTELDINSQVLNVLVYENPKELVDCIAQLTYALDGENSKIRLVEKGQLIKSANKIDVILNLFDLDLNNKKIVNAITKRLTRELLDNHAFSLHEKYGEMYSIVSEALNIFDNEIVVNENMDTSLLIKMFNPSVENIYDSLLEKLIAYINLNVEMLDLKCLIILHAEEFFTKNEVIQLFNHCRYKEVALLLIESRHRYQITDEVCLIVDEDLCEILA